MIGVGLGLMSTMGVRAPLRISPSAPSLAAFASQTFTASGGTGTGYTYSLVANASGGFVNSSSGVYYRGPLGGTDTVRVTDSGSNTSDATVTGSALSGIVAYYDIGNAVTSGGAVVSLAESVGGDAGKNMTATGSPTYTASNSSYGNRPTWAVASGKYLKSGSWSAAISQGFTVYQVGQSASLVAFEAMWSNDAAGAAEIGFWGTNSGGHGVEMDIDGAATAASTIRIVSPGVICALVDGLGGPAIFINDHTTAVASHASQAHANTLGKLDWGTDTANADPGNGVQACMLVVSNVQDVTARNAAFGFFGAKYGIAVT